MAEQAATTVYFQDLLSLTNVAAVHQVKALLFGSISTILRHVEHGFPLIINLFPWAGVFILMLS